MNERRIYLLKDEEIALLLTGLRLLDSKSLADDDLITSQNSNELFHKIENCYELGVINDEKN